ncbi:hypothetical protein CO731_01255 [Aminobacter sp. MSH1]|uniref:hypothetical protein n=1 Tax=Aminobacter sp. MSH1 TaxID=374606 RepID=UPI000D38B7DC|nr:hypothetical protein [Aminobacter sp. MSH1]AWC21802.1 hypothetical protein CO731_01255 [Aminobacter sp. MSH1]
MKTASTQQINQQIGALDNVLAEMERDVERLSLGAVSGNAQDIEALAGAQSRIAQATNDRAILQRAHKYAAKREAAIAEKAAIDERARQFAIAQDHAGKLLEAARRADDLVQSIRDILEEIQKTEGAAWTALRASGRAPAHGGAMWQNGLWKFVLDTVQAANNQPAFRPNKTIAQVAEISWRDVAKPEAINV